MTRPFAAVPEVLLIYTDDTGAVVTETFVFESVAHARRLDLRAIGIDAVVDVPSHRSPLVERALDCIAPERAS